jgi:predicted transcriptional regulator
MENEDRKARKKAYKRAWYQANREKHNAQRKAWAKANPEKVRRYHKISRQNRMDTNPLCRLSQNIRTLVAQSFRNKGFRKESKTAEILGCSFEFFKAYIEQRFMPGMSWENRSEWHLDHVVPVASAKTEAQILRLNHYSNFRPLWAAENIRKSDSVSEQLSLVSSKLIHEEEVE